MTQCVLDNASVCRCVSSRSSKAGLTAAGDFTGNLLSNAIKFLVSSPVRNIKLEFDLSPFPPNDDSCQRPDKLWNMNTQEYEKLYLYVKCSDTGPGMTRESLAKLFNRFVQASTETHAVWGGNGIGLFITRRLCELMDGRIEVDSELGHGCEFRFFVAVQRGRGPETVATTVIHSTAPPPDAKVTMRILIVEDNLISEHKIYKHVSVTLKSFFIF